MTDPIEEYWEDIRPPKPAQRPINLAEIPVFTQPPEKPGEFKIVVNGVQCRGYILELRVAEDLSMVYGQPRRSYDAKVRLIPEAQPEELPMVSFDRLTPHAGGSSGLPPSERRDGGLYLDTAIPPDEARRQRELMGRRA